MYIPTHVKANVDMSEFYLKSPNQMSRYELQELEKMVADLQAMDENEEYSEDHPRFGKAMKLLNLTEEKKKLADEFRQIQPARIGIMKRYWDKFKYNKSKREDLIKMFDESDQTVEMHLGDSMS